MVRSTIVTILLMAVVFSFSVSVQGATFPQGDEYTNSMGMDFVRIEAGSFMMGFEGIELTDEVTTPTGKKGGRAKDFLKKGSFDEYPAHWSRKNKFVPQIIFFIFTTFRLQIIVKIFCEFCSGQIAEIAFLCFQLERAVFMLVSVRNLKIFAKFRQISNLCISLSF